jgi:hypothetical protein
MLHFFWFAKDETHLCQKIFKLVLCWFVNIVFINAYVQFLKNLNHFLVQVLFNMQKRVRTSDWHQLLNIKLHFFIS